MRRTPELDARTGLEKLAKYPYQILTWVDDAGYPVSVAVDARINTADLSAKFDAPAGLTVPTDREVSLTGSHIRPQPGYGYDERRHVTVWGPATISGGTVAVAGRTAWGWDEAEVPFFEYSERSVGKSRAYFDALSAERGTPVKPKLSFGFLTLRTARFTEYFVPFSVVAFALAAAVLGARLGARKVLLATLVVCIAYSARETGELLDGMEARQPRLAAEEASAMRARIPPGAQVFTCEWGLTGTLMLALPERRFIVALDPTLFAVQDPERYDLWYRLPREAPAGLATTIRERFGARYVACLWDERFRAFFDRIAFEPGVSTVSMSGIWNVYELRDP